MGTFSKIFSIIINIITGIIALIALGIIILYITGTKPAVVLSGSMEPVVETGSVAFVNTKDRAVSIGDIVQYKIIDNSGKEVKILHRIIDQNTDGSFVTKGDNNEVQDQNAVDISQINGKYVGRIPGIGFIIETPLYLLFFVIVVVGLHILSWIFDVISSDDDDDPSGKRRRLTLD